MPDEMPLGDEYARITDAERGELQRALGDVPLGTNSTAQHWAEGILAKRLADQRNALVRRIEAARSEHWQQHLREHPLADAKSCPRDHGIHDAYAHAVNIVRLFRAGAES